MIIIILILIGIVLCPRFTLGCLLLEFDYPLLGIIAILVSFFSDNYYLMKISNTYK